MKNGSIGVRLLLSALLIGVLFGGWYFFLRDSGPDTLDAPVVDELPDRVSGNISVTGMGERDAVVSVLVDGKDSGTAQVHGSTWRTQLYIESEGIHIITAEQRLGSTVSRISEGVDAWVDITPPDSVLRVVASPPERMNKKEFTFVGTGAPGATILVNAEPIGTIDVSGDFSVTVRMDELENILIFTLADDVGNATGVVGEFRTLVDSTPARIRTQYCSDEKPDDLGDSEEYVCLRTGSWTPYGISAKVPITGAISGRIESITLNGEVIASHNTNVYQEMVLPLLEDVNTYPIVVIDTFGNESLGELIFDTSN